MNLKGTHKQSPDEMYLFSLIEDSHCGFTAVEEDDKDVEDLSLFRVDWEVADDPVLMAHHSAQKPDESAIPALTICHNIMIS